MQVTKQQLERQQLILKVLGFYHGDVDGVWGPDTIKAKKRYEMSPSFVPGIPANGLPFADGRLYPNGITLLKNGLLHHPAIDAPPPIAAAVLTTEIYEPEVEETVESTVVEPAVKPKK